jgi:hypothetical protein
LTVISTVDLQKQLGVEHARILDPDESIHLDGGTQRGRDLWKRFGWCVLGCLLLEKLILAWPMLKKPPRGNVR